MWSNGESVSTIIVSPNVTTVYCVTVTDSSGCTDTACVIVTLEPTDCSNFTELCLPNAFSPNTDTQNDKLHLLGGTLLDCIKELNIVIYSRWGEKVFESNDKNFAWDGTFKGKPESAAVFGYYIKAVTTSDEVIRKKGNISLLR